MVFYPRIVTPPLWAIDFFCLDLNDSKGMIRKKVNLCSEKGRKAVDNMEEA
ncbi:MAG: hypothetical protein NC489_39675 [Ruminococcus flavefaciens]|nr:hypothetical protein [Ruminococcus flavefaciens]